MKTIFKKATVILLVLCMLCTTVAIASAKTTKFDDVPDGEWFTESVKYVTDNGYFSGTGTKTFSPNANMTRAMFVTVLAALSKEDSSKYSTDKFTDVPQGQWYAHTVAWALDKKIVSGTSETAFSPDKGVTRQEVCLMFVKFLEYKGYTPKTNSKKATKFSDDSKIATWAYDAVYKNLNWETVSGKNGNIFDPSGYATRAQLAVMVRKLATVMENAYKIIVKNIDVQIDGLTKEYKFLQISDAHLTLTDDTDSKEAKDNQNTRGAMFNSETTDGVKAEERFEDMLAYSNEQMVDFVAMTGDIIDAPSNGNISFLSEKLKAYEVQSLYVLGNHDWTGDWLGSYQSEAQRNNNIPKFVDNGIIKTNEDGFAVRDFGEFKIVCIDNSNNEISESQFWAFNSEINDEKPIILLMHVPVDVESFRADSSAKWGKVILMGNSATSSGIWTTRFVNMLKKADSPVVAIFAGHVHIDHEDKLCDKNETMQYSLGASFQGYTALVTIHG